MSEEAQALNDALLGDCPSCLRWMGTAVNPAQAPHICPFRAEIRDDRVTKCECCPTCMEHCRKSI